MQFSALYKFIVKRHLMYSAHILATSKCYEVYVTLALHNIGCHVFLTEKRGESGERVERDAICSLSP